MRPSDHAVGLAARQIPGLLEQARGGLFLDPHQLLAPTAIVLRFRDHRLGAHRVQHRRQGGARDQEIGRQRRQVGQCRVEQLQHAGPVKDRQTDGQIGKGLGQRLHEFAQRGFRLHRRIGGDAVAQHFVPQGHAHQVEPLRSGLHLQFGTRQLHVAGGGRDLEQAGQRPGQILTVRQQFHRADQVGVVGPDHLIVRAFAPHQDRRARQHRPLRQHLVLQRRQTDGRALALHHVGGRFEHRQPGHPGDQLAAQDQGRHHPGGRGDMHLARPGQIGHDVGQPRKRRTKPHQQPLPGTAIVRFGQHLPRGRGGVQQPVAVEQEYRAALIRGLKDAGPQPGSPSGQRRDQHKAGQHNESCGQHHAKRKDQIVRHATPPRPLRNAASFGGNP